MGKPTEQIERVAIRFCGDSGDGIQLTGKGILAKAIQNFVGDKTSMFEPVEQVPARTKPLDLGVHGDRDGIQEIQSRVIGDEERWWALGCHRFPREAGKNRQAGSLKYNC